MFNSQFHRLCSHQTKLILSQQSAKYSNGEVTTLWGIWIRSSSHWPNRPTNIWPSWRETGSKNISSRYYTGKLGMCCVIKLWVTIPESTRNRNKSFISGTKTALLRLQMRCHAQAIVNFSHRQEISQFRRHPSSFLRNISASSNIERRFHDGTWTDSIVSPRYGPHHVCTYTIYWNSHG